MTDPIPLDALPAHLAGIDLVQVEQWIALDWVRPDGAPGHWQFTAIDVARLRLIVELRTDLGVDDGSLPVVLHLVDQLYATRRAHGQGDGHGDGHG